MMLARLTSKIRHTESRGVNRTEHDQLLADVQAQSGELDQLKRRISRLVEQRLDFAERLLAKQREDLRLAP